ncbi:hypothetical protein HZH68_007008 [Vespula germanica]|uniref:Uncharacterized protein n=1 Tax=Vespula germanica TaxID=30212 RepID=A0A834K6W5_VESGE|nr:hypothetical protein HZH68_007008 [Vespula germanica]
MGIAGQYFAELEPNFDGPPKAIDPAVRARKLVGMERRDMILTAVFGTVGALAVIVALGLAVWFYLRARKSKQRDDDLEDPNEHSDGGTGHQTQSTKKNGFLNLKTCLISTKTLGFDIGNLEVVAKIKRSIDGETLRRKEVNQVVLNLHEGARIWPGVNLFSSGLETTRFEPAVL